MSRDRVALSAAVREHEAMIAGTAGAFRDVDVASRRVATRLGWPIAVARQAVLDVLWSRRTIPDWCPRPPPDGSRGAARREAYRAEVVASRRHAAAAMRPAMPVQTCIADALVPPHKRRRCGLPPALRHQPLDLGERDHPPSAPAHRPHVAAGDGAAHRELVDPEDVGSLGGGGEPLDGGGDG